MNILVINRGSSTIKSDLYHFSMFPDDPIKPLWSGILEWKENLSNMRLKITYETGKSYEESPSHLTQDTTLPYLFSFLTQDKEGPLSSLKEVNVIGHRVVLGGKELQKSTYITAEVKQCIKQLSPLAPLHNPVQLQGIELAEKLFPNTPQVAVFDTAFHHTMPPEAIVYPIPFHYFEEGIQRFGFHGISFQYCLKRAIKLLGKNIKEKKIVICHLGSGASLCAIKEGKSIDTTMGFTPLEGLMMNTRCGSIDPGILCYLLQTGKETPESLSHTLYYSSGLLGITGTSCDMRDIVSQMKEGGNKTSLAFNTYIHILNHHLGSMIASLSGLDLIIFTGGIGENSTEVRQRVCDSFSFLDLHIDKKTNDKSLKEDHLLSTNDSKVQILLIHTQESFEISRECFLLLTNRHDMSANT